MTDFFRDQLKEALGPSYEIVRELEGGGMSRVYLARERALDRDVVVKVLPPELAAGVNRDRFRREIQLAAQLQHPHIVPLLSAGESGDLLYYTMPFIAGESLKAALKKRGRIPTREVVRMLHDVVDALAYAHARGVIHRDIKPANVLMSGSHAVITDFGVAKALSAALPLSGVTTAGVAIGTPAYMAPEQLAADPAADHRVDIYAVGLLAYELLTGESPFTGDSPAATMAAQLTRIPEPLASCCPDVPDDLSAVVMRCLEKQPAARYASATDLLVALNEVSTPQGSLYTGVKVPAKTHRLSRRYVAFLSALLTVAIGSALALSWSKRNSAESTTRPAVAVGDTALSATLPLPGNSSPVLTRAESLAIAAAVQKKVAETRKRAPAPASMDNDSLKAEVQRILVDSVQRMRAEVYQSVLDSMRRELDSLARRRATASRFSDPEWARAFARSQESLQRSLQSLNGMSGTTVVPTPPMAMPPGAPPRTGVWVAPNAQIVTVFTSLDSATSRRVAVARQFLNGTGRPELDAVTRAAADSLRAHLLASGQFDVVPADSVADGRYLRDPFVAAQDTRSGVGIVGIIIARGDELFLQVHVGDRRRANVFRSFKSPSSALDEPFENADELWDNVVEWLEREGQRRRR